MTLGNELQPDGRRFLLRLVAEFGPDGAADLLEVLAADLRRLDLMERRLDPAEMEAECEGLLRCAELWTRRRCG